MTSPGFGLPHGPCSPWPRVFADGLLFGNGRMDTPAASPGSVDRIFEKHLLSEQRDAAKRFVRGGFWRNFLTKYEESNNMHKKMLRVVRKKFAGRFGTIRRPPRRRSA